MNSQACDKFDRPLDEGDIVKYNVYGVGPGKPWQQPEGNLRCFIVHISEVGEVYLDPRCDPSYKYVIKKASPDFTEADLEKIGWLLVASDPADIELYAKSMAIR